MSSPIGNIPPSLNTIAPTLTPISRPPEEGKIRENPNKKLDEAFKDMQDTGIATGRNEGKNHSPRGNIPTLSNSSSKVASSSTISAIKDSVVNSSGKHEFVKVLKQFVDLGVASKERIEIVNQKRLEAEKKKMESSESPSQSSSEAIASTSNIKAIYSVDKHSKYSNMDSVCLNYIHSLQGIQTSLTNPAKGGLSVVLEREADVDILKEKPLNQDTLNELSERAHQSFLFVISVDRIGESDARLELTNSQGSNISDSKPVYISPNNFGCMETRAEGTINPKKFTHIIVSERMKPLIQKDEILSKLNVVYVSSQPTILKYRGKEETIDCPDYEEALSEIFAEKEEEIDKNFPDEFDEKRPIPEFFTHMARCPTETEIIQGVFEKKNES